MLVPAVTAGMMVATCTGVLLLSPSVVTVAFRAPIVVGSVRKASVMDSGDVPVFTPVTLTVPPAPPSDTVFCAAVLLKP